MNNTMIYRYPLITIRIILIVCFLSLIFFSCKKEIKSSLSELPPINKEENIELKKRVLFYNWEEYIGTHTIENFYNETGITVIEKNFFDEEDMMGEVQSNLSSYDIVVASDDLLREMIKAKMLSPLNFDRIPNFKYIAEKFRYMQFDPDQKYTVPYLWGTTGLVINTKYITDNVNSWDVLFDPAYKKKTALLNNYFEVFAVIHKKTGNSINSVNPNLIKTHAAFLASQQNQLSGFFDVITLRNSLINEKLWAAQIYSGEGLAAVDENPDLMYIIPREGAVIWVDNFCILRDAKNKENAHIFINYLLEPRVNAAIASELWYASANETAKKFIDEEVLTNPSVYPTEEVLDRCEFFDDIGDASRLYSEAWNMIQVND